jgi:hypothetical protein
MSAPPVAPLESPKSTTLHQDGVRTATRSAHRNEKDNERRRHHDSDGGGSPARVLHPSRAALDPPAAPWAASFPRSSDASPATAHHRWASSGGRRPAASASAPLCTPRRMCRSAHHHPPCNPYRGNAGSVGQVPSTAPRRRGERQRPVADRRSGTRHAARRPPTQPRLPLVQDGAVLAHDGRYRTSEEVEIHARRPRGCTS